MLLLMVYITKKKVGGHEYYYLVDGKRVDGKVKQKMLAYIGDKEALKRLYENIKGKIEQKVYNLGRSNEPMEEFDYKNIECISLKYYQEIPVITRIKSENNFVFLLKFKKFERVIKIDRNNEEMPWRILKEIYLTNLLKKETTIPVPEIEFYETNRETISNHWMIMKKMGESDLNKDFLNKLGVEKRFIELGKILASCHKVSLTEQGFIFHDNLEQNPFIETIRKEFKECTEKLLLRDKITPKELEIAESLISKAKTSEEAVLCHNDFGPWQAVTKRGKITCIIDWELAISGYSVYDFAKAELMMKIWSGNTRYFRQGYEQIKKLPSDYELIKVPYQILETIKIMAFFIENENNFKLAREIFLKLLKTPV